MIKTHKIALAPTSAQKTVLSKHCGYARVAYNHCLSEFNKRLKADKEAKWSLSGALPAFNALKYDEYEWCHELSQNASKNAIRNLDRAISNWRNPKLKARKPKKHKRCYGQSYQADNGKGTVKVFGKAVCLPKIGWVKMRECLRFDGEMLTVTVTKSCGRWFVCISVKIDAEPDVRKGKTVGIDMGLKTLAVYSDGTVVENPQGRIDHQYRKLRKVDKAIARSKKVHGKNKCSNRRNRLYEKRQRIYGRIRNIRDDAHHKATSALVSAKSIGKVVVESLNVAGMRRNKRLSRAFHRAGISGFLKMLEYKCVWNGVVFEKADRWFASTKTCSGCGEKKVAMDLSEREYVCLECGLVLDRDLNAAINLKNYDADSLAESQNGRGGFVRPVYTIRSKRAEPVKRQSDSVQLSLCFA